MLRDAYREAADMGHFLHPLRIYKAGHSRGKGVLLPAGMFSVQSPISAVYL